MQRIIKNCNGAIPIIVIICIIAATAAGGIVGFKLGDGSIWYYAYAAGIGLIIGVIIFPNLAQIIRWFKSVLKTIKE